MASAAVRTTDRDSTSRAADPSDDSLAALFANEGPAPAFPPQDMLRFDAEGRPRLPFIERDACEGEECTTRFRVVACRPTVLRAALSEAAPVAAAVAAHDTMRVWRFDHITRTAGIVVIARDTVLEEQTGWDSPVASVDTLRLSRGDTLFLFPDRGGTSRWTYHSKAVHTLRFWTDQDVRAKPEYEEWWYVQTRRGATGWWRGDSGHHEIQPIDDIIGEYTHCEQPNA